MNATETAVKKIESIVSGIVGDNPRLLGYVDYDGAALGQRKIGITIQCETFIDSNFNEASDKFNVIKGQILLPIGQKIRKEMDSLGYSVSNEEDFLFLVRSTENLVSPVLRFRSNLFPKRNEDLSTVDANNKSNDFTWAQK